MYAEGLQLAWVLKSLLCFYSDLCSILPSFQYELPADTSMILDGKLMQNKIIL